MKKAVSMAKTAPMTIPTTPTDTLRPQKECGADRSILREKWSWCDVDG